MEIGTRPQLILSLNLFRKLFGYLYKMRNHCISMEVNTRVIVTQKVKMQKKAHLHQEILIRIKPSVPVISCSDGEQKHSNIALLECAPSKCILFPFLRPRAWRCRRKPRVLSGGTEWDKVHPDIFCPLGLLPPVSSFPMPSLSLFLHSFPHILSRCLKDQRYGVG